MTGLPGVDVSPSPFADDAATDDGLGTIASALRLVAVAAVLAGGLATALALDRLTRVALRDRHTLAAMGWSRRGLAAAVILVFAPWLPVFVYPPLLAVLFLPLAKFSYFSTRILWLALNQLSDRLLNLDDDGRPSLCL